MSRNERIALDAEARSAKTGRALGFSPYSATISKHKLAGWNYASCVAAVSSSTPCSEVRVSGRARSRHTFRHGGSK